jgi:transcriptional regulator with XRE-family HTH domain
MDEKERREALGAFLRTRRARLQPTDVGLPVRPRRRTPGLRREDVAELANIGVSWYTLLEQGQDVHPSRQVLESLAQALRLTPAEEKHLFLLAAYKELPVRRAVEEEPVSPALQRVVDALDPHPAFIIGQRWDILTWNRAAGLLFSFHEEYPPYSRNVLWRFFQRKYQTMDPDWERQAQALVAQFRADYARYPGDAAFREIIKDLQEVSPEFCTWWEQQNVRSLPDGPRIMMHPTLGQLEFDHVTFLTPLSPDMRVKIYSARPSTILRLEQALAVTV